MKSNGTPAAAFFAGRSFHASATDRQAIPVIRGEQAIGRVECIEAAGILQPPVRVARCVRCGEPVHATESTDEGLCATCAVVSSADIINPPTPREDDAITAAFTGARATIAKLESKRIDYTEKVDALLAHAASLGFTEEDFADLALAAADQAGVSARAQDRISIILNARSAS